MTSFAQQIAKDSAEIVVFGARGRAIPLRDLQTTGVATSLPPSSRVAVHLRDPLNVITVIAALDGQVDAILLLSHDLQTATAVNLARSTNCTMLVQDKALDDQDNIACMRLADVLGPVRSPKSLPTTWLMTTSGTTGLPKVVPHTLRSLSRSVYRFATLPKPVWGLLYDPTRFAGLQVVLQSLMGGGQLVVVDTSAPLVDQVETLANQNCTHLSATPTLWRRLLMVPRHKRLPLRQVTLGGEIADQATLNALRIAFPNARRSHIYASTEAGVGFSVSDDLAGFPLTYLERAPGNVRINIRDDILWICPPLTELPPGSTTVEIDSEGYVRSGDRVAVIGDRVVFLGRENGLINIGGVKVYPETVEAVIKTVSGVTLVKVSAKRNPVTGSLVVAEIQLEAGVNVEDTRRRIQEVCRASLEREAVPAIIRFVDGFATNAAGKLVRTGAL
jgi:acyl-CoA synthetase (AMP-forming)/AMP-acid ligase II